MSRRIELKCSPRGMPETRVLLGTGITSGLAEEMGRGSRRRLLVADRQVLDLFPGLDLDTPDVFAVEAGEDSKSLAVLGELLEHMASLELDRGAQVIALGGGSLGDLAGLAASLFLRGVELIMVPTTLLSMVDSSVGGKTAINLPQGKNLVGSFWPASTVWIDPLFLSSLSDGEFLSGMGEVLKAAIGLDPELFATMDQDDFAADPREPERVLSMVEGALRAKVRIVESDPNEGGARRLLNLGHTLGHALERQQDFAIPHGIAVAQGIHHVIDLAAQRGVLDAEAADASRRLLLRYGLPPAERLDWTSLLPFLRRDKKMRDGELGVVLPVARGRCEVHPMSAEAFTGPVAG